MDYHELIKDAANKRIMYTQHALDEMNAPDELISAEEVRYAVFNGEIIEEYPSDKRGHSFLLIGKQNNKRTVHVVCAPKDEYLAIITAYIPSSRKWEADFKTRRKK